MFYRTLCLAGDAAIWASWGPVIQPMISFSCPHGAQKLPSFSVAQGLSSGVWLRKYLAGQLCLHCALMLPRGELGKDGK